MGVASLVLGIISIIFSFIPVVGYFFLLTAIISIVLGIVSLVKKKDKGKSIAGIITSVIAIIITIVYTVFIFIAATSADNGILTKAESAKEQVERAESKLEEAINSSKDENSEDSNLSEQYEVGEKYIGSDLSIEYISFDDNFTDYYNYAKVEEDEKVIKAEFEFENTGDSSKYVSSYNFNCYADSYDCDSFWSTKDSSFYTQLSSGKKTKGTVYFKVPKDSQEIIIEYKLNALKDEKVEFLGE